jgi:NAD(P)-dependent dehydrogenase (short-subunit alcohol dehydrogenase family)
MSATPLEDSFLIVGASSSLGASLIRSLTSIGMKTVGTVRNGAGSTGDDRVPADWLSLDLSEDASCLQFAENLTGTEYGTVILMIGQMTIRNGNELTELQGIISYYSAYTARYHFIINQLIAKSKGELRILNISSRATKYGSWDEHYAACKASIEVFLRSKSRKTDGEIKTLSLSLGMIEGSGMLRSFDKLHIDSHRRRAGGELLTLELAIVEIERVLVDKDLVWDGRVILIGPDYI